MEVTPTDPRASENDMDFWYSSEKWKDVLRAGEAETICVPPCLDVLKSWKRENVYEAPHLAANILGQTGEAEFMKNFQELNIGGILVSGLNFHEMVRCRKKRNNAVEQGEWDAIFFHQNRGIFVIEVKATEVNDETVVKNRMEKANTQLNKNIEKLKHSFRLLYQKECICITGYICFPFRNEDRKTYEGYRVIDKSALNDRAIFRKFFEPRTNEPMIDISLLQRFVAEFVCCRSQVEFHSQAYNAMQIATWIMEQDISQKQDPIKIVNMPGNGPSGKIILTAEQLEIVECKEKCIVICGAPGSGKTLILMLRALDAAMDYKPGSVFVFVNEKLKAKYEKYFFEEKDKIIWDRAGKIDRRPKVHTIDMINFIKPEDDVFFDETPVEDCYIKEIENRVNYSGSTTVVFTGLYKPGKAVASLRLYQRALEQFKHFELMKMLRGTGNIFEKWEHYYTHGITMGHNICGVAVKSDIFDSFDQVQNEIANKITALTSANISTIKLLSLKKEHIAVVTCDDNDSTEMRSYFDAKKIPCGQVNEQARMSSSNVAVDVYLNTPSYEWPIVFVVLKPGFRKEEVLPIAASRCIASLTIFTYENVTQPSPVNLKRSLESIQNSLRRIYSKSYRNVIPLSLPFFFDIEEKWVNLTLKLESNSIITEDYVTLLKKAFAKADMLIIEGDPGMGKSSLMHRLAYEWTQSRLSDYDLVLYIEFRKLREFEFKDIEELITHYMKGYLDEQDYKIFHRFINDSKCCKEHKILVLLDGYDESFLEKQCQELSDYFSSTISRPLQFNVLITSRKGYLSNLHNQGRFTFADIIGFTAESQKQKYISKHFNAINDTESSENIAAVTYLLNTNANIKKLSEIPLMLTFICLLHKNIIDGTEVELYMNIIWWMIDRYQKSYPNQDVPNLFEFEHDERDKFHVIENSYHYFPQLHFLGEMAMQDIFKSTFMEEDLKNFHLNEIVIQVGLLRKEETRDSSFHKKTEFSFVHRTVQEFITALTFFISDKISDNFLWYVTLMAKNKNYGIIPAKIETFLKMVFSSKLQITKAKKIKYYKFMDFSRRLSFDQSTKVEHNCISAVHFQGDVIDIINKFGHIPQSSEEAFHLLYNEAEQGDDLAQFNLGIMFYSGIITIQSDEEAAKWFKKSADQGNANAQLNLANMYENGQGIPRSNEQAVKWLRRAAEQEVADAQFHLGVMYRKGQGVPLSDVEAVKWFRKAAEQGNVDAQNNLRDMLKKRQGVLNYFRRFMYRNGIGVPHSDEKAVRWYRKAAEQGDADAQFHLGVKYLEGQGVPQSDEEAVKWFKKAAEQGHARGQYSLGWIYHTGQGVHPSNEEALKWYINAAEQDNAFAQCAVGLMYRNGKGVPQSDEEAVIWYTKAAEQGNDTAQYILGHMYRDGRGTLQSDEEAVKWFKKSAEQGNAYAQYILGHMYRDGRGTLQSDADAVKWFKKSAEQRVASAQCNLGYIFMNGRGVPQSDEEAINWYTKSAEQGNAYAQYILGHMYRDGRGTLQSDADAVKWFKKSAEQRVASAQCNLGYMFMNGRGVPQSDEEAINWYTKSAEQGNAYAQYMLGHMYYGGRGTLQSDAEAVKWFKKSAEQGKANAQYILGHMYRDGRGTIQSDADAVKWFRKSAEQGNAYAQYNLGYMYQNGRGVPQSPGEAVKWYRRSAEQGNADAQYSLGFMYKTGRGVPHSDEEAVKWYRKAAKQGLAEAQCKLGFMCANGRGLRQSDEEAVKWFRKSAVQAYADAQYALGVMYEDGRSVPQSDEEAFKWYRKAAEQGHASAQFYLGMMYQLGQGVRKSDKDAVKWYRKAVKQGHVKAQYNLAIMYRDGRGIPQSDYKAVKWYIKAAEQGHACAQNMLGIMAGYGRGMIQSDEEAFKWYWRAAEQGYAEAQYNLGMMYWLGQGVRKSEEDALLWFRKAAELGNAYAQNALGEMYQKGNGVSKSDDEAVEWYRKAAEQGYDNAQDNLECMYRKDKGISKSDEEAVEWSKKAAEQGYADAQEHLGDMFHFGDGVSQSHQEA